MGCSLFTLNARRIVQFVACVGIIYFASASPTLLRGQDVFDDFEDGSFVDGTPAEWLSAHLNDRNRPATISVNDGKLILDSIADGTFITAELVRVGSNAGEELRERDSWSIRGQFQILAEQPGAVVHAGIGTTARQSAWFTPTGILGVAQDFNVLTIQTDFEDIMDREFVIQLDIQAELLTGYVWPADAPADRWSVEYVDQSRLSRPLAFNRRTVAAYEYLQVSETPIPLPGACSTGDFDCDGMLGLADVESLRHAIFSGDVDAQYDVNGGGTVDLDDLSVYIKDIKQTWFGDANWDGLFNSGDLIAVFQAGEYDDRSSGNSTWSTGDWNADGEFDSGDLIIAFADGGYDAGERQAVRAVPEPSAATVFCGTLGFAVAAIRGKQRWNRQLLGPTEVGLA
jgi:hypothetical protein